MTGPHNRGDRHSRPIKPNRRTSRRGAVPCSGRTAGQSSSCLITAVALGSGAALLLAAPPTLLLSYFLM